MNIIFDASVLNNSFTGVAKTLLYLYKSCKEIDDSFHAYGIYCTSNVEFEEYGITLININEIRGNSLKKKIENFILEKDIKIFHYPNNYGIRYNFKNVKNVLTLHDVIPLENKNAIRNPLKKIYYLMNLYSSIKMSDCIFTVSKYSRNAITKRFNCKDKINVIHWGATLPDNYKESELIADRYYLYVGGFDKRKGIDILVKTYMKMVKEKQTDSKLVLLGKKASLGKETDDLILEGINQGNIIVTGYVTDEEVCCYLKHAICLLYLSYYEGFGLPIIEGFKNDCPVITTKGTCLPEIAGDAVLYVDREDESTIISAMKEMEFDNNSRNEIIMKGKKRLAVYDWEKTASNFLKIINKL
ncbi:MAG: glycosyltransferase family 1 protein [Eubacteriales bacterium]|nr:glycosyltransferase family 1 protein [Eubacteriales bacterium]